MHSADTKTLPAAKRQLALFAAGVAILAAGGFMAPLSASANLSASLVQSLPVRATQEFPAKTGVALTSTAPKQQLAKTKPKATYTVVRSMTVSATAYTSSVEECDANPFTTASGTRTHWGTIAYNGLPFGTLIHIKQFPGITFRVEDRGGMSGVDIWMPTKKQAYDWGRRTITIQIVKRVK
ncbi:MAG: 3D domain-containing protein [Candidatus Andersenbacteria bacterium]